MRTEKHLQRILYIVFAISVILVSAMNVCGASSGGSVTIEKGKVYQEDKIYTGWYILNSHKYYADAGRRVKGWKKIGSKYYYFNSDYTLAQNVIVGTKAKGYYYVDQSGVKVTAKEIKQAVDFVMKNSSPKNSQKTRLKQCFRALCSYRYMHRETELPKASKLPGYADYMFTRRCGNCYYYGTAMAYIAKVLGYNSRVAAGAVTAWGPNHALSAHGWCEVYINSEWKMIDCSMQNAHSDANLFLVSRKKYPYRLRCDKEYVLAVKNGKVSWK